ncbi:MAG: hypothetical protein JWO46_933 [Nocardioidaceae bacterium]|nr:hypothetical protein [Nocardioidaceae bacterium]
MRLRSFVARSHRLRRRVIRTFEQDRRIDWTILGVMRPPIGHVYGYLLAPDGDGTLVTSYYDWSHIDPSWRAKGIFPVIAESSPKATLGILERAVVRGYVRG